MSFNEVCAVDDGTMNCYAYGPTSADTPAVLVLQEIFGVNANIRKTVDRLAGLGYRAAAPDLFWRQRSGVNLDPDAPDAREEAMALAAQYGSSIARGMEDLRAVVDHLRSRHRKVAVLGYCLGGKMAFLSWLHFNVDAVVSYYGVGMDALMPQVDRQRTPLLMHLGREDPLNPPQAVAAIRAGLAPIENARICCYDGVGHAFARLGASSYVEAAAERADETTFAFLRTHLAN